MFLTEMNVLSTVENVAESASGIDFKSMFNTFVEWGTDFAGKVIVALLIWLVGKRLVKFGVKFTGKALGRTELDAGVVKFLCSLLRFSLHCILIIIVVDTIGIQTSSLITVVGSAGLAVGLALQGSLANFAGGVLILIFKPFVLGDYIIAAGNEGTVSAIDLLYTKLNTVDNKMIMIPNGTLANTSVVNVGKENVRRVDILIGISYESDIRRAKELLGRIIEESEYVLKDREIQIIVKELAASSVNLETRVWVQTPDYWTAKFDLTEKYKYVFDENGISIPYTQLDVHLKQKENQ